MCKTCGGAKVKYQFVGSMMMLAPCEECNPKAKKPQEVNGPYENSR